MSKSQLEVDWSEAPVNAVKAQLKWVYFDAMDRFIDHKFIKSVMKQDTHVEIDQTWSCNGLLYKIKMVSETENDGEWVKVISYQCYRSDDKRVIAVPLSKFISEFTLVD